MDDFYAGYRVLYEKGQLKEISNLLFSRLQSCSLCPHGCGVDRTSGEKGKCRSGIMPIISSYHAHFGEEAPLVGRYGSGTIFFTHCNLSCIFCQNYDISQHGHGEEVSFDELARIMLLLQEKGCHNINFVTPTHMVYAIVRALEIAVPQGLSVPLVYNSGGYDSDEVLREIAGIFDIYMPDFKYMNSDSAEQLSGAFDYPIVAMKAIKEMYAQVGDLQINKRGLATRGLLVRHLVLPNNCAESDRIIQFIAGLSKNTYLNIMDQYRPTYRAHECFDLKRRVTLQEFDDCIDLAKKAGLMRIDGYF